MNVQTAAIAASAFTAVVVTKTVLNRRASKRVQKDFEETVNSMNAMLQKLEGTDNIYVTLPA